MLSEGSQPPKVTYYIWFYLCEWQFSGRQNYNDKGEISGCRSWWGEGQRDSIKKFFEVIELLCILIVVAAVTQMYICIKIH